MLLLFFLAKFEGSNFVDNFLHKVVGRFHLEIQFAMLYVFVRGKVRLKQFLN